MVNKVNFLPSKYTKKREDVQAFYSDWVVSIDIQAHLFVY
jgi:hypothetical protein